MLLSEYQSDLEYDDLVYILALEDYDIFHDFMSCANAQQS